MSFGEGQTSNRRALDAISIDYHWSVLIAIRPATCHDRGVPFEKVMVAVREILCEAWRDSGPLKPGEERRIGPVAHEHFVSLIVLDYGLDDEGRLWASVCEQRALEEQDRQEQSERAARRHA